MVRSFDMKAFSSAISASKKGGRLENLGKL